MFYGNSIIIKKILNIKKYIALQGNVCYALAVQKERAQVPRFDGKERVMNTQFKKGVLELCVLSLLKQGDKYGYELADTVGKKIDISEGTIYPLLKRLRAEGYFEVYLKESTSGPARKYYKLTQKGKDMQAHLEAEWQEFTESVSTFIGGDGK